ncbi:Protein of uncharacterised function (DUF1433) [Staphylococcus aureus]|uniref:DUF1433 domain-containing protein n=1 Tax=Staphylococcus aureus TaxID=1280 RepID=UPI000917B24D|nr:DUF1433 domain-containing protein [Staphylococcus aureus]SGV37930.1 Protein of uncharacterised function (DUF1433) [Staphylococcus aureus]
MSKKKILILTSIMLIILISVAGIYLKMKYDEKEKRKAIYYKEQQARITLYLKHNTKEPNTIKSVHFTNLETSPMGSAVIEGYINENKKDNFTAYATPEHNYQFGGAMIKSEGVDKLLKPAHERKSPDDIKKELNKK